MILVVRKMTETTWDASNYLVVGATYENRGRQFVLTDFIRKEVLSEVLASNRWIGWAFSFPSETYAPESYAIFRKQLSFSNLSYNSNMLLTDRTYYELVMLPVVTNDIIKRIMPDIDSIRAVLATTGRDKAWDRRRHLVASW